MKNRIHVLTFVAVLLGSCAALAQTPPTITTQPADKTINQGQNTSISVAASGTAPLACRWWLNGSPLANATNTSLSMPAAQGSQSGRYWVVVTNCAGSVTSRIATVLVVVPPVIVQQPLPQTAVQGDTVTFSVVATGTAPTYQWKFNGGAIAGATNATLVLPNVQAGSAGKYKVEIQNAAKGLTSTEITLTVVLFPFITTPPQDLTALVGQDPKFTVSASGTEPFTFFWRFNGAPFTITTAAELRLSSVQLANTGRYSVVVSNAAGVAVSGEATLTVNQKATILKQPGPRVVGAGDSAGFSVAAQGTPAPTYQWLFENQPIPGANTPELVISPVTKGHKGKYKVVVGNSVGQVTSTEVTLTVYAKPAIVTQPQGTNVVSYSLEPVEENPTVELTVEATGDNLRYQWYRDDQLIPAGANNTANKSTLELPRVRPADAGVYYVQVWNDVGQDVSQAAPLNVLTITSQPQGVTNSAGSDVVLNVQAVGPDLHYLWSLNGDFLPGAADSTLILTNVSPGDGGLYSVTVFNEWGAVESDEVIVKIECPALPFDNEFKRRGVIQSVSGTGSGNNSSATREGGEPLHADQTGGHSVWLTWVAPADGIAVFDTVGSDFDTVLAVYTGAMPAKIDALTETASDDESGGDHRSSVMFNARTGTSYQIAVDSADKYSMGNIVLRWQLYASQCPLPDGMVRLQDKTVRPGETVSLCFQYAPYQGPCQLAIQWLHNGQPVPDGDQACLDVPFVDGSELGTYSVRVTSPEWQYFSESMELQYNTEGARVGARNRLSDSTLVALAATPNAGSEASASLGSAKSKAAVSKVAVRSSLGGSLPAVSGYSGSQVFVTYPGKDPTEPSVCGVAGGASYWFTYVPPTNGTLFLNTDRSSYDTVLGVFRDDGRSLGYASLILVASDNNSGTNGRTSAVKFPVSAGTRYFIMVDGVNGARGLVFLNYRFDSAPTISAIATQTIYEDQSTPPLNFTISDRETSAGSLLLAAISSNPGLVSSTNILFGGSGTNRTVSVSPTRYRSGASTITLTVTDAVGGTRTTSFLVNVLDVNHPPQAYPDFVTRSPNTAISINIATLLANDVDPDGDTLTLSAVASQSPYGGTIKRGSTYIIYTPSLNYNGMDYFTYTVKDSQNVTATGMVYVNVNQTVVY